MYKILIILLLGFISCSGKATNSGEESNTQEEAVGNASLTASSSAHSFNADSAYVYLKKQVDFGPRVPNSEAHRLTGDWLKSELARHGAEVLEQKANLRAFDGTVLHARNIMGRLNPDASRRILLLAHYDCRPWADQDSDPEKRKKPVDGANDGASGVAVLLETARCLKSAGSELGVDILFVDAEDYGTEGNDESWAMGARHFAQNPPIEGYSPECAVLLDMVGGKDAVFPREYFSQGEAPELANKFYAAAAKAGHGSLFPNRIDGAVTDDHLEFLKVGIPAIDIIEYRPDTGFNPTWHTADDNIENISPATLKAVGESLLIFLNNL